MDRAVLTTTGGGSKALRGQKLPKYSKYAPLLKNSIAYLETPDWMIFLMKDQAAVEEATKMGAEVLHAIYRKYRKYNQSRLLAPKV